MSYRIEVLMEHLDVLDKLVELVLADEAADTSGVYELAVWPGPAEGGGMTLATGPAVPVGSLGARDHRLGEYGGRCPPCG
jgi:hypothetical protein